MMMVVIMMMCTIRMMRMELIQRMSVIGIVPLIYQSLCAYKISFVQIFTRTHLHLKCMKCVH